MNRDHNIKALRPFIESIDLIRSVNEIELFQNEVIRPILKFQSELLVEIFSKHTRKLNTNYALLSISEREKHIASLLRKDLILRNLMIGSIMGLMTSEDIQIYYQNELELRKRIIKMLEARLLDKI